MGRYSSNVEDAILDSVLDSDSFAEKVKEILSEEIESSIKSAIEDADIQDKVDTTISAATQHLENIVEADREAIAKLMSEGEDFHERFANLEATINGLIAENEHLKGEIKFWIGETQYIRSDLAELYSKTTIMNKLVNHLRRVPGVQRLFM